MLMDTKKILHCSVGLLAHPFCIPVPSRLMPQFSQSPVSLPTQEAVEWEQNILQKQTTSMCLQAFFSF